ncbi:ATP-binding cassette domain-containing protein [Psychrosphaera aestuarii]|uniref:ATP-binding cassette domain-containing protein n=1 Tax=Psychrosphaera aestuarii TaxID=1266052 RepID=UPI001B323CBD|nr:ATP-binding cassette domain-containing protein [Psychrosphaera aestuarii]
MLTLNNVTKTYSDGTKALQNITINFPSGMVGLLGPNGAGKSSLLRTIAGLQAADSGSVLFTNGINVIDVLERPDCLRKTLGYLPQEFGVYPHMSCIALLEHMAVLKGLTLTQREQQIPQLLELTNLTKAANKSVANYSGGMKQRFGIAQALLGDPKLIVMDEPTAGLDPVERQRLNDVLVNISKDRLVLLSTHIVEDVENLCRFVAMQFNGKIVVSGNIPNLLEPLRNKVWRSSKPPRNNNHADFPDQASNVLLNKTYCYGDPVFRIFSDKQPNEDASLSTPTLQDRYFLEQIKSSTER